MPNVRRAALQAQGAYYVLTGLWPLVSRRSFEAVTGPKSDWWLVQTVGLLAASTGVALIAGARDTRPSGAVCALAGLTALSFAWIDAVHSLRGRISKIYLADAAAEVAFALVIARS